MTSGLYLLATEAWITDPMQVLAVLIAVLAALFGLRMTDKGAKFFGVIPLLLFAYFVPTFLSNVPLIPWGDSNFVPVIPTKSPLYSFVSAYLLPASLMLLVLTVDIPAILRLGKVAVIMFLAATATIILGGPFALLVCSPLLGSTDLDVAWRGLAALSGSWIGGGANMVAIQKSVNAPDSIMGLIIVIDVAVANLWMFVLLTFAGKEKQMDARLGADRSRIDFVREQVEGYQRAIARPTNLGELLIMLAIAFVGTVIAESMGARLHEASLSVWSKFDEIGSPFMWKIIVVTTMGVVLSFTRARRLEGAGASAMGSVFLYILVATIGAKANFVGVVENWRLVLVGLVWMAFHAGVLLLVRHFLKAPVFFLAVGSKANVGGAASAPVVAAAFHPSLAAVGVLLGVAGYVLGTYGGLLCAILLEMVANGISGG